MSKCRVGIDVGGTFTDLVKIDETTGEIFTTKVLSNPDNVAFAILNALEDAKLKPGNFDSLVHGTTVTTNTLIERTGERVALITTKGFKDVIFIQRMNRKHHYDLDWDKPKPYVMRRDCFEINERTNSKGEIVKPSEIEEVENIIKEIKKRGIKAIAIAFIFSYINPINETKVKEIINNIYPEAFISLSHEVYPRWREYERFSTTIADVYLKPRVSEYFDNLAKELRKYNIRLLIMKSNSGIQDYKASKKKPINLIMSGPVGGVTSGIYFGNLCNRPNIINIDMGGTSLDVSLIQESIINIRDDFEIEWGLPIRSNLIDVKTIGAGGGSISWIDKGGLLRVGPQSAGAQPGPICYNRGGTKPTVTDANLLLGRLNPNYFAGGTIKLNAKLCKEHVSEFAKNLDMDVFEVSQNILDIINFNMVNVIRLISIDKGLDPRDFTLIAFGGAGSLHAVELAEKIGISEVIIPVHQGVFSALGLLTADMRVDKAQTVNMRSDRLDIDMINEIFENLRDEGLNEILLDGFKGKPKLVQFIEMRYYGQNYGRDIPINDLEITQESMREVLVDFSNTHKELYGYALDFEIVEFINFKVTLIGKIQAPRIRKIKKCDEEVKHKEIRPVYFKENDGFINTPIYDRDKL